MPKLKDLTGKTIGQLTVISRAPTKNKKVYWNCICSCGKECVIRGDRLKEQENGGPSCGHIRTEKIREAIVKIKPGDKINQITVLEETLERNNNGGIIWKCRCDCGKEFYSSLVGKPNSCGCYQKKVASKTMQKHLETKKVLPNTWENNFFIEKTEVRPTNAGEKETWCYAICPKCNEKKWLKAHYIRKKTTISCGCVTQFSRGEIKITNLLSENKIKFEKQKTFDSCRFKDTGMMARFDFYLPDYNILIEYDGEQHFYPVSYWGGEKTFVKTKERDRFKNNWAKKNNYKLIRIPYLAYDSIALKDLLEQSPYLL